MAPIVYPPTMDWHRMVQRPQQLLWAAARAGHVVIFCNLTQRADRAMDRLSERFYVCHNVDALLRAGLPAPTLYVTRPEQVLTAARFLPKRVVLDVVDLLPGDVEKWPAACAAATDVWCASPQLLERVRPLRPDARYVPNASDFAFWSAAAAGAEPVAAAVLPHPRVSYLGTVGDAFDTPAFCQAARELPDVHFLVVGPVLTYDWFQADGLRNVHCVGEHPYPQVPALAQACDALVLQYREGLPTAQAAEPVKLWNYLATGRPVVCSGVPAAEGLGDLIHRVPSSGLATGIRAALEGGASRAEERSAFAASRSWDESWRLATAGAEGAWMN